MFRKPPAKSLLFFIFKLLEPLAPPEQEPLCLKRSSKESKGKTVISLLNQTKSVFYEKNMRLRRIYIMHLYNLLSWLHKRKEHYNKKRSNSDSTGKF